VNLLKHQNHTLDYHYCKANNQKANCEWLKYSHLIAFIDTFYVNYLLLLSMFFTALFGNASYHTAIQLYATRVIFACVLEEIKVIKVF